MDLKLGHLRQHQLPLHKTPEAQKKLQALYPDIQEWKTGLCIQGYLFSPMLTDFHPAYSTASHGKGHWWYLRDFLHYQHQQTDTYWIILDRQHWLAPAQLQEDEALKSNSDLLTQLHHKLYEIKRPLLLAALKKMNANDQYLQETWRGFIVPDNWPDNR